VRVSSKLIAEIKSDIDFGSPL